MAALQPSTGLEVPAGLSACHALLSYEGEGRRLVTALKYRNARAVVGWLAEGMALLVAEAQVGSVTWAPTSRHRRAERGFDQAELLARAVAAQLGCPARRLLRRRAGPPQTGLSRAERLVGPAFVAPRAAGRVPDGCTVVVDDVITSGTTLSRAAQALLVSGVQGVVGLAAAHTPSSAGFQVPADLPVYDPHTSPQAGG